LGLVNVRYVTVSICETSRSGTSCYPACGPSVPCRAPHPPPSSRLANHAQRATPYSSHGHQWYRMPVLPLVFLEFPWHLPESVAHPADGPPGTAQRYPLLPGARPLLPGAARCYPEPPGATRSSPEQPLCAPAVAGVPSSALRTWAIPEMPNKMVNDLVIKAAQASRSGPTCPRYLPLPARAVPVSAAGSGDDY
jgi:hypothetical protein